MMRSPHGSTRLARSSPSGGRDSSRGALQGSKRSPGSAGPGSFPPEVVVAIKALACELPWERGIPVSRLSTSEIKRAAIDQGIVASIGETTVWRWMSGDAIRPWCHRSWIFPRDPKFMEKAGRVLDLYERKWKGRRLGAGDYVISADEKTSIQARQRKHRTLPPRPGEPMKVEHEYTRCGALAYIAAWDVHRARIYGRCEKSTGILSFNRLVAQVMRREPYRSAHRVFWIMDNGSSHRGNACVLRMQERWPNIIPVHTPVHASWLNQVEIYFSILQRKALTPNYFNSLEEAKDRLLQFGKHYEKIAKPFEWKFTRKDLDRLMGKLDERICRSMIEAA